MRQSLKIIRQALDIFPASGPVNSDDWHVVLPPEGRRVPRHGIAHLPLQAHHGRHPRPEPGSATSGSKGANGELGFYAISDGGGGPYRLKVRPPCFPNMAAFEKIIEGGSISDAVATLGSLNIIAGELER